MNKIKQCEKCDLYKNQLPLLDTYTDSLVMFVGLSSKKIKNVYDTPLDINTNSGKIVQEIETILNQKIYKTNLVKCLPLDLKGKLRYPTNKEMNTCIFNLIYEINLIKPKFIFLLGEKVSKNVESNFNLKFIEIKNYKYKYAIYNDCYLIKIEHPSYIYIYKRKEINNYINNIIAIINHKNNIV